MTDTSQLLLPHRQVLPLEFYDNTPFLIGEHNGKHARFMFDSGAQDLTLNARYLNQENSNDGPVVSGFTGKIQTQTADLGMLKFGNWEFSNRTVLASDFSHIEEEGSFGVPMHGLIGFRQMIHCDWMVDYKSKELHVWEIFPESEFRIAQKIRVRYRHHMPMIEVKINGHLFRLLVDTGAPELVLDEHKKELVIEAIEVRGAEKMVSSSTTEVDVLAGTLVSYIVGNLEYHAAEIKLTDMSGIQRVFGDDVDGIVGHGLLSQFRTVVCWNRHRFYFLED